MVEVLCYAEKLLHKCKDCKLLISIPLHFFIPSTKHLPSEDEKTANIPSFSDNDMLQLHCMLHFKTQDSLHCQKTLKTDGTFKTIKIGCNEIGKL